jgi:hypothetical protein
MGIDFSRTIRVLEDAIDELRDAEGYEPEPAEPLGIEVHDAHKTVRCRRCGTIDKANSFIPITIQLPGARQELLCYRCGIALRRWIEG